MHWRHSLYMHEMSHEHLHEVNGLSLIFLRKFEQVKFFQQKARTLISFAYVGKNERLNIKPN